MRILTCGRRTTKTEKKRGKVKRPKIASPFASSWLKTEDELFKFVDLSNTQNTGKFVTVVTSPGKTQTPRHKNPIKRIKSSSKKDSVTKHKLTPSKSPASKKVRRALIEQDVDKENVIPTVENYNRTCNEWLTRDLQYGFITSGTEDDGLQQDIDEMLHLVPSVMENLSKEGHEKGMLQFFKLTSDEKFPMQNISLQLWLEVVKWFGCESGTEMRYSESTKKFWKLGYRLFGGQFLCFMSGPKNTSSVVLEKTEKGLYPPCQSEINFAVPGKKVLSSYTPFSSDRYSTESATRPGILTDMIENIATIPSENSYCVTFDGKKLKRGLTESSGDVDLLGFETGPTLQERRDQLQQIKKPVDELVLEFCSGDDTTNIADLSEDDRHKISKVLREQLQQNVF